MLAKYKNINNKLVYSFIILYLQHSLEKKPKMKSKTSWKINQFSTTTTL
jgi:hypothetical protein